MERRALAIDPGAGRRPQLARRRAAVARPRSTKRSPTIHEALRLDPDNGQAHQALARALWVGKGDFAAAIPVFERSIALNPEAGYSYLQLVADARRGRGDYVRAEEVCRRAVELQEQYISGNAGLQMVGANARLGYVRYLRGDYDEAIREYERGMAFLGASDHALQRAQPDRAQRQAGAAYLAR